MYVHLLHNSLYRRMKVDLWDVARETIDLLPDLVLLEIFDFYVEDGQVETWHTLVHVSHKWRNVVFGSPRRLRLRLLCRASTPVREMLEVWPLLPIVLWGGGDESWGVDNTLVALEHNDRICQLELTDSGFSIFPWEEFLAEMQKPFPALTCLLLRSVDEFVQMAPVDPNLFLGGSAPRLQTLRLERIPFPGLPKLLLSAIHLVDLQSLFENERGPKPRFQGTSVALAKHDLAR